MSTHKFKCKVQQALQPKHAKPVNIIDMQLQLGFYGIIGKIKPQRKFKKYFLQNAIKGKIFAIPENQQ